MPNKSKKQRVVVEVSCVTPITPKEAVDHVKSNLHGLGVNYERHVPRFTGVK